MSLQKSWMFLSFLHTSRTSIRTMESLICRMKQLEEPLLLAMIWSWTKKYKAVKGCTVRIVNWLTADFIPNYKQPMVGTKRRRALGWGLHLKIGTARFRGQILWFKATRLPRINRITTGQASPPVWTRNQFQNCRNFLRSSKTYRTSKTPLSSLPFKI